MSHVHNKNKSAPIFDLNSTRPTKWAASKSSNDGVWLDGIVSDNWVWCVPLVFLFRVALCWLLLLLGSGLLRPALVCDVISVVTEFMVIGAGVLRPALVCDAISVVTEFMPS
jgi:hypothetical protein